MSTSPSVEQHDRLVLRAARHLKKRFYKDVRARTGNFDAPEAIRFNGGGYTPDVTMINKEDRFHIFEVETPDSIEQRPAAQKWKAFADFATQSRSSFWLVVPKGARAVAEARLRDLGVEAGVWEV